jgi:mannose-6-phosphate isomerase-like protein (cupin superfamily)
MYWPGYHIADAGKSPKPILSDIPVARIPPMTVNGVSSATVGKKYNTANCSADVEELAPGTTFFWFFHYDEIHYVCQGEADIVYSLASTSHTVRKDLHVKPGDFYLVPLGARLTWTIPATSKSFKVFSTTIPGMPDSSPSRASLMKAAKKA